MKSALLIHHLDDAEYIEKNWKDDLPDLYSHETHFIFFLRKFDIKNFYSLYKADNLWIKVEKILAYWYKNSDGIDKTIFNGISWARVVNSSLMIAMPSLFREYLNFKVLINSYDVIFISKNEPLFFLKLIDQFKEKIQIYDPGHNHRSLTTSINLRKPQSYPNLSFGSNFLYFVQKTFINKLAQKDMFLNCWTTKDLIKKRKNAIIVNGGINIFKSAYTSSSGLKIEFVPSLNIIQKAINQEIIKDIVLSDSDEYDGIFLDSISKLIAHVYSENIVHYSATYKRFLKLYESYKPKSIILPGVYFDGYQIAAQLAKYRGIKAIFCQDGMPSTVSGAIKKKGALINPFQKCDENSFDTILANGMSNYMYFIDDGVPEENLRLITPSLLHKHRKNKIHVNKKYQVMIMSYVPMDWNPDGFHGSKISTLITAIQAAKNAGITSIAIKAKHITEIKWIKEALKYSSDFEMVEIIAGPLYTCINRAELIIGGFSTAAYEAHYNEIPYIVFEPYENGYSDNCIQNSNIIDPKIVARDSVTLTKFIASKKTSIVGEHEFMFSGESIISVDL